jgi:MFS family permease
MVHVRGILTGWVQIHRDVKILVLSMFLWEIGLTLYDALLPVYLRQLGATVGQVGFVFLIAYLIAAFSSIPGGWLAERFNRKRVMVLFWMIGTPSVLLLAFARDWQQAQLGISLYFLSFMTFPTINAYLTDASDPRRMAAAFSLLYATFPAAQLLGPGAGGWIADRYGFRTLLLVSFGFYLVSTLVISRLTTQPVLSKNRQGIGVLTVFHNRKFVSYAILAAFVYLVFTMMIRFLSPYLVEERGFSLFTVGILNSVAAAGGVFLTPLFGFLSDRVNRISVLTTIIGLFVVSLVMIGWLAGFWVMLLAFFLQGCFIAARSLMDTLVANMGKGRQVGLYFGAFGLLTGLGQMIAPAVGGWFYTRSPDWAFIAASSSGILLILILIVFRERYEF